jgi:segregation and condensation protein B
MENLRNIIESLLFVSDEPLTVDKLKTVLETVDAKEIRASLNALADQYEARGGGFRLCEVADAWQLRSRSQYNEYIKRLLQPPPQRLSRAALETLAIVAYNQPIIRADIEHIRGVDSGGMLRQLLERKLIRVLGRKEIPGRPLIYATSKLFLELFELKNLKDLPTPKEIAEMGVPEDNAAGMQTADWHRTMAAPPYGSTPIAVDPGLAPPGPFGKDTASPSAASIAAYDGPSQRVPAVPKATARPASAAAHKILTHPSKINAVPSGISSTPFKLSVQSTVKSQHAAPVTCGATMKKNVSKAGLAPRTDKPKKP